LYTIESLIYRLSEIYTFLIIGYVLMSWIPNLRESFIGEFIGRLVEPYLSPFRRIIPPIGGMLDISPIIAIFALQFVARGIVAIIGFLVP
jgi:YggT family protein/cell division inhibitor SepF